MKGPLKPLSVSVIVAAELPQLKLLTGLVLECLLEGVGLEADSTDCRRIQLAVREASSNVVRHAYEDGSRGSVGLRLKVARGGVFIEIRDRGLPIPAARLADARRPARIDPENPAEGGYGLRLIEMTMDRVSYRRRRDGSNCVRLYKKLADAA